MSTTSRSSPAMARANGIELCYDAFGDRNAAPLILIMGLAAQMIAWDEAFCAQLADRGFWAVRFDNRDIGLSTKLQQFPVPDLASLIEQQLLGEPLSAPYTLRDMAADTVGLMDALGIESAHVVGVSMGGAIAQEMAIHSPNRVRTLTSIMSSTGEPGLPPPTAEAMAILLAPMPTDRESYLVRYARTWQVLRGPGFPLDQARDAQRAAEIFERGLNPPGVARQLAAIVASGSRKDALRAVHVPALVIHGDVDPLVPLAGGIATANAIPGAKLVVIKGMGHALPIPMWPQIIEAIVSHAK
ncbi:MAG: alpha/beta fold hydrolase [Alphaproteobacteria bacterium]|nr:MAG: alpha/beta fold hydrolase [Alphaproteobacteria bacterium]